MKRVFLLSLPVMAALVFLLIWLQRTHQTDSKRPPLIVYLAPALRPAMDSIQYDYQKITDQPIELRYGASNDILVKLSLTGDTEPGDIFLPADDSYIEMAREKKLIDEVFPIARMRAVLLVSKGKTVTTWDDLLRDDLKIAIGNHDVTAIGKVTRDHLKKSGRWDQLEKRITVSTGTVTESANAVKLGSVDAAIIWDALAGQYPDETLVRLPELNDAIAQIQIATLTQSKHPAEALEFAKFVTSEAGLKQFRSAGYTVSER